MIHRIHKIVHKKEGALFNSLLEAEQDDCWVTFADNPDGDGLISCGQSNCYALIVQFQYKDKDNNDKINIALAHVSSSDGTTEFLQEMIEGLGAESYKDVSLTLARSFKSYTDDQQDDRAAFQQANKTYDEPDAETYFAATDEEYATLLAEDFAGMNYQFVTMPHDFLAIDSTGTIHLFEEFSDNIYYEEIDNAHKKKKAKATSSATFFNPSPEAAASSNPTAQDDLAPKF